MTTVWDPATYSATNPTVQLIGQGEVSPVSRAGMRRTIAAPGGFWRASWSGIDLYDPNAVRAWRAFVAAADNGAGVFEVRLADRLYAPWPLYASGAPNMTAGGIVVALDAAASVEATTIRVAKSSGGDLAGGINFSATGPRWGKRLYRTKSATDLGGGDWSLEIRPGLREDLATATALDFETPGFLATVANPREIEPELSQMRFAQVDVVFQEDFSR